MVKIVGADLSTAQMTDQLHQRTEKHKRVN